MKRWNLLKRALASVLQLVIREEEKEVCAGRRFDRMAPLIAKREAYVEIVTILNRIETDFDGIEKDVELLEKQLKEG